MSYKVTQQKINAAYYFVWELCKQLRKSQKGKVCLNEKIFVNEMYQRYMMSFAMKFPCQKGSVEICYILFPKYLQGEVSRGINDHIKSHILKQVLILNIHLYPKWQAGHNSKLILFPYNFNDVFRRVSSVVWSMMPLYTLIHHKGLPRTPKSIPIPY